MAVDAGTLLAAAVDKAGIDRFAYQREAVRHTLTHTMNSPVLNVGCKEDPVPLKPLAPTRVVNCDMVAHDELHDQPNKADVLFDCAREPWPFADQTAAMVVFGDILEHLDGVRTEIWHALDEARRVALSMCITVPMDTAIDHEFSDRWSRGVRHRTCFTGSLLRECVQRAGWEIAHFRTVDYVFLPVGFLMCCV